MFFNFKPKLPTKQKIHRINITTKNKLQESLRQPRPNIIIKQKNINLTISN